MIRVYINVEPNGKIGNRLRVSAGTEVEKLRVNEWIEVESGWFDIATVRGTVLFQDLREGVVIENRNGSKYKIIAFNREFVTYQLFQGSLFTLCRETFDAYFSKEAFSYG